jgi:hypothetical protein
VYTGKVYTDHTKLSHGWIEDPWRLSEPVPSYCNEKHVNTETQMKQVVNQIENKINLFKVECRTINKLFPNMVASDATHSVHKLYLDMESLHSFEIVRIKLLHNLRHFMWTSQVHAKQRRHTSLSSAVKALYTIERSARKLISQKTQYCALDIYTTLMCTNCADNVNTSNIRIDPEKADYILTKYILLSIKYAILLCIFTDIYKHVSNFTLLVCSILYMKKQCFKMANVQLFEKNPLLELLLPNANQFNVYKINKTMFTATKTYVKTGIMNAVKSGVPLTMFVSPIVKH